MSNLSKNGINKTPLVYIIMPCYNGEKYLLEQLMSIYYQNYTNRYLIFVNDWSSDNTEDILRDRISNYNLYEKVKFITKENGGVNSAVQRGLEEVKNMCDIHNSDNLISYCDADDIWTRDKLSVQVEYMVKFPKCWLTYHNMAQIDENWCLTKSFILSLHENESFLGLSVYWNHILSTEIMFRINFIEILLPFPVWFWMYQDYWTVLNFSILNIDIQFIDKQLAYYRRWHQSLMRIAKWSELRKVNEAEIRYLTEIQKKYPDKDIWYIVSYKKDRLLKWYDKSRAYCILLIFFKHPRIFAFLTKDFLQKHFWYKFNSE